MNSQNKLIKFIKKKKFKKIFLITGKQSYYKSGASKIFEKILKEKIVIKYFKKKIIPELSELKLITKKLDKFKPNLFLAIGGGAVMDYAKTSNVLSNFNNFESSIKKSKLIIRKKYPLLTLPTTAGSGAEVTSNAVIYINKKKFSIEGKDVKPDKCFLIHKFVQNLPFQLKSEAGFDAISQSIESILSVKSTSKSISYASQSLKISSNYFLKYLTNSSSENAQKMQLAANLSGKAIDISKTIAPHAVSYPFTSHFHIKHGHAVSLTLSKFLKFNYENIKYSKNPQNLFKKFKIIFKSTNTEDIFSLIQLIEKYQYYAKLESDFKKLKIDIKKKHPIILDGINTLRLKNNPIRLNKKDIKEILINR